MKRATPARLADFLYQITCFQLRFTVYGLRFAFLVVLLSLLAGCSNGPPESTRKLPDYPGAVGVEERKLDSNDTLLNIYRSISFTTSDAPESVLKFYRDKLPSD